MSPQSIVLNCCFASCLVTPVFFPSCIPSCLHLPDHPRCVYTGQICPCLVLERRFFLHASTFQVMFPAGKVLVYVCLLFCILCNFYKWLAFVKSRIQASAFGSSQLKVAFLCLFYVLDSKV